MDNFCKILIPPPVGVPHLLSVGTVATLGEAAVSEAEHCHYGQEGAEHAVQGGLGK